MTIRRGRRAATGFLADFRDFIMRGNVVDLAVGIVIGAAFTGIINSFVGDIITPLLLQPALKAAGVDQISSLTTNGVKYGVFLAAILNFLVVSFVLYLLIRAFEEAKRRFEREEEVSAPIGDPLVASQERLTSAVEQLTQVLETRSRGGA